MIFPSMANFCRLSSKLGQCSQKVRGGQFSAKLGKMPLHGKGRYSVGTHYIRKTN
jgi:hypothetical protein